MVAEQKGRVARVVCRSQITQGLVVMVEFGFYSTGKPDGSHWKVLMRELQKTSISNSTSTTQLLIFLQTYSFIFTISTDSNSILQIAQGKTLQLPLIPFSPNPPSILPLEALVAAILFSIALCII